MEIRKLGWTMTICAAVAMGNVLSSCSDSDTTPDVTYDGTTAYSAKILFNNDKELGNGDQEFVFTGDVTLAKGTYLLKGWVYVADGAKLRIPAGTIIKGDKETKAALIVEPGGYVEMKGTQNEPIVMTSEQTPGNRKPGDWGGLIICGKAKNNQTTQQIEGGPRTIHGGSNDNDNSGIYQYVRVEFAGYPFAADKEINGITFGSVGSATTIDHLQVSYSNDDSFEWFGGTVNCKYLVAYKGWDDEFDTDNGFSGTVQYCLSIRDPRIADTSQSNGFESDNNANGTTTDPFTTATFKNVTFIGPGANNSNFDYSKDTDGGTVYPDNGSKLGKFQSAMQIRRSSQLKCENTLAVGYPIGLIIDWEKGNCNSYATAGNISLKNIVFAGMTFLGSDVNKKYANILCTGYHKETGTDGTTKNVADYDNTQESFSATFFKTASFNNKNMTEADLNTRSGGLTDLASTGQKFCPTTTLSDGNGGYIGAFKNASDNWLAGWTNFDPQNTVY